MEIESIEIEKINLAPYNPRNDLKPGDAEYESLRRSIEHFGYVDPLVWNKKTGNLVGGHQRFKILLERGEKSVQVSVVDLEEKDEKALNIALNKISGKWDYAKLADLITSIDTGEFDLTLTGFSLDEIENMATWSGLRTEDDPSKAWEGMPGFDVKDKTAFRTILVHFKEEADVKEFFSLVGQSFTDKTKFIWFPEQQRMETEEKRY